MRKNLSTRIDKLEADLRISEEESPRERFEREAHERYEQKWLSYFDDCGKVLDTIPDAYDHVIEADLTGHSEDELMDLIYHAGFLGGGANITVSPLLLHVLGMVREHERWRLDANYGYDGPLVVPDATCEVLTTYPRDEVHFESVSMGGTQCRECRYWLPIGAYVPGQSWAKPLLDICPVCGGEPVNYDRRHEIKRR